MVLEPPVFDERKKQILKEPKPGIAAQHNRIISDEQYFLFDRTTFGWRDTEVKASKSREGEFKKVALAVASDIGGIVLEPMQYSINPTMLNDIAQTPPIAMSLEELERAGAFQVRVTES
jgi:hypothetical protein